MVTYFLLNVLSVFWSYNRPDALYFCFKVFLGLSAFVYFFNVIQKDLEQAALLKSLLYVCVLFGLIVFCKLLSLDVYNHDATYKVTIFSEHRNLVASAVFLFFGMSLYAVIVFKHLQKLFSIVVSLLLLAALLLLQVRSVYFALIVSVICLVLFAIFYSKFKRLWKFILLGIGFSLIFICGIFLQKTKASVLFSPSSLESLNERFQLWEKTLLLIKESPLFGVGAANWQYNYSKFGVSDIKNACNHNINFQQPHNDVLCILSETGFVGFSLVIGIFVLIVMSTFKKLRAGMDWSLIVLFCFFIGIIFESFFSFPKERILHIVLIALMIALIIRQNKQHVVLSPLKSRLLISVICSILLVGLFIGVMRIKGEYYTLKLLKSKAANDARATIRFGKKAISPFYITDPTSGPIYSYLGWAYNHLGKNDSTLWATENSCTLSPYDYEELSNYGFALEKARKRDAAILILKESIRINSCYNNAKVNLALSYYNAADYSNALVTLKSIPGADSTFASQISILEGKIAQ